MLEPVWTDETRAVNVIKHEGFFVDHRCVEVKALPESVYPVFTSMGGRNGWPYANWLWKLRGWLDKLFGGAGLRGHSPLTPPPFPTLRLRSGRVLGEGTGVRAGDLVDYYRVESLEPNRMMRLHSELRAPGEGWMEWRVDIVPAGEAASAQTSILTQTAFFAPRGLPGYLYWYLLYPLHSLVFHGLIHAIAKQSASE